MRRPIPTPSPLLPCLLFLALVLGVSASDVPGGSDGAIETIADLNGKRLGVIAGTMLDQAANNALDYTIIVYFDDLESEIRALLSGEIDAVIDDEPLVRLAASVHPRLRHLPVLLQEDSFAYAMRQADVRLKEQLNAYLADLRANGKMDTLLAKWLDGAGEGRVMPPPAADDDRPVLRIGVSPVSAPFAYSRGGRTIGFDIEVLEGFSRRIGARAEFVTMEFSGLIPSLLSGKVDIIGAGISVTEERARLVAFSDSYYDSGVSVLILKDDDGASR